MILAPPIASICFPPLQDHHWRTAGDSLVMTVERSLLLALDLEVLVGSVVFVGFTWLRVVANLRYILDKNSPIFLLDGRGSSCRLASKLLDVLSSTSPELLGIGVLDVIEMAPG